VTRNLDKVSDALDGAVDVTLGGEVNPSAFAKVSLNRGKGL
jgi:hypothetical protein